MLDIYQVTVLEEWIESTYKAAGIFTPDDLSITNVSKTFNIQVFYLSGAVDVAMWDDNKAAIFLNSDKSNNLIREVFFHELCHPLRHCGDQMMMYQTFLQLQETQASHFQLYAALPFFMIKGMKLPEYEKDIPYFLATEFKVTLRLARKRWDQIKRRIYDGRSHHEFVSFLQGSRRKADPNNITDETKRILNQLNRQLSANIIRKEL